jgi:hypothetical protein
MLILEVVGTNRETDLTDDAGLCGAFLVWFCREKRMWSNGRLISATWDTTELEARKEDIEGQDLLKWGFRVGEVSKEKETAV